VASTTMENGIVGLPYQKHKIGIIMVELLDIAALAVGKSDF